MNKQKDSKLGETYRTASGEHMFRGQKRQEEEKFNDKITGYEKQGGRKLLTVWGLPGCGKSYLMKRIVGQLYQGKQNNTIFAVYIDISDCADESEVYYRIALQLRDYYGVHGHSINSIKAVKRLIRLYEWVKGIQKEDLSVRKK